MYLAATVILYAGFWERSRAVVRPDTPALGERVSIRFLDMEIPRSARSGIGLPDYDDVEFCHFRGVESIESLE